MPSNFSTIGMPVASDEEFITLLERAAEYAKSIDTKQGSYLQWASDSGAELWMQLNKANELVGVNPHFSGDSRIKVGLVESIQRPEDAPLDGAYYAWADPPVEDPLSGIFPFVFDLPDFQCYPLLIQPVVATAQVAAFARELDLYATPETYSKAQQSELKFASQSFIPSGMFNPDGGETDPPQAYAVFTGHILQSEQRKNELKGQSFYWILVETLGGTFDVVADPQLVNSTPQMGGVLSGSFWLSGRLVDYPKQNSKGRKGLLKRLFNN